MHAYLLARCRQTFPLHGYHLILTISIMIFMISAPLFIRSLEHGGHEKAAFLIAFPAYIWMGWLFMTTSILILLDVIRLICVILSRLNIIEFNPDSFLSQGVRGALLLGVLITIYAYNEAKTTRKEHIVIKSHKIPQGTGRFRIIQISDLHLGILTSLKRVGKIATEIEKEKPDMIVSTGDLVDGRLGLSEHDPQGSLAGILSAIKTPAGKFAVLGNHEIYAGTGHSADFMSASGFRLLRGEACQVAPFISVAGVDDPAAGTGNEPASGESTVVAKMNPSLFRILLKHRPFIEKGCDGKFDLQLSGHTHNGQLFPFNLLVRLQFRYLKGTYTTDKGSMLHVSRGTGTWGPPLRFLAPPELTVIDIIPASPEKPS